MLGLDHIQGKFHDIGYKMTQVTRGFILAEHTRYMIDFLLSEETSREDELAVDFLKAVGLGDRGSKNDFGLNLDNYIDEHQEHKETVIGVLTSFIDIGESIFRGAKINVPPRIDRSLDDSFNPFVEDIMRYTEKGIEIPDHSHINHPYFIEHPILNDMFYYGKDAKQVYSHYLIDMFRIRTSVYNQMELEEEVLAEHFKFSEYFTANYSNWGIRWLEAFEFQVYDNYNHFATARQSAEIGFTFNSVFRHSLDEPSLF